MKKSLLTLGAVAALAVSASAQGTLGVFNASSAGFNTVTSNPGSLGPATSYPCNSEEE